MQRRPGQHQHPRHRQPGRQQPPRQFRQLPRTSFHQQDPHWRCPDVQRHMGRRGKPQGPVKRHNVTRQHQTCPQPKCPPQRWRQHLKFPQPGREPQQTQQNEPRHHKPLAARKHRRPRGHQPFGAHIVSTPQKDHQQQTPGNGPMTSRFRHAASKPTFAPIANEISSQFGSWVQSQERLRGVPNAGTADPVDNKPSFFDRCSVLKQGCKRSRSESASAAELEGEGGYEALRISLIFQIL